jgi:hypothetical protein
VRVAKHSEPAPGDPEAKRGVQMLEYPFARRFPDFDLKYSDFSGCDMIIIGSNSYNGY